MQLRVKENGEESMSNSNGGFEVREAPSSRSSSLLEVATPALELKTTVRMQLYTYGTSLVTNDNDFTGDGDQSPVKDAEAQQMYQDLFRTGQSAKTAIYCLMGDGEHILTLNVIAVRTVFFDRG